MARNELQSSRFRAPAGIAAASPQARSLSMVESLLAVLSLAVTIARLMGAKPIRLGETLIRRRVEVD